METGKTVSKSLATIALSSTIGFAAARIAGYTAGTLDFYIFLALLILFLASLVYLLFYQPIENGIWWLRKKNSLRNPSIGILNVTNCPRSATRFSPDDWLQELQNITRGRKFKISLISQEELSNKYSVIINPYGEYYPEEDLAELKTLQEIKEYVSNGGVFVNAGGIAFFYGYDALRNRQATLARELEGFQETGSANGRLFLPVRLWPAVYAFSLSDTPLWNYFKVITTHGTQETVTVYQEDADRRICGDIQSIGNTNLIREFRAAREPLRNARPLLRARWPNQDSNVIVYPLIAIPQKRGCLVLGGMALDSGIVDTGTSVDRSERDKVIHAVINLLENQRNGNIPFDWRRF